MFDTLQILVKTVHLTALTILYNSIIPILLCFAFYVFLSRGLKSDATSLDNEIPLNLSETLEAHEETEGAGALNASPAAQELPSYGTDLVQCLTDETIQSSTRSRGSSVSDSDKSYAEHLHVRDDRHVVIPSEVASTLQDQDHDIQGRDLDGPCRLHESDNSDMLVHEPTNPRDAEEIVTDTADFGTTGEAVAPLEESGSGSYVYTSSTAIEIDSERHSVEDSPLFGGGHDAQDEGYASDGDAVPQGDVIDSQSTTVTPKLLRIELTEDDVSESQAASPPGEKGSQLDDDPADHHISEKEVMDGTQVKPQPQFLSSSPLQIATPIPASPLLHDQKHIVEQLANDSEADNEPQPRDDVPRTCDTPDTHPSLGRSTPELDFTSPSDDEILLSPSPLQAAWYPQKDIAAPVTSIEGDDEDPWALNEDDGTAPLGWPELAASVDSSDVHRHESTSKSYHSLLDDDDPWNLDDEIAGQPDTPEGHDERTIQSTVQIISPPTTLEHISTAEPTITDNDEDPWDLDEGAMGHAGTPQNDNEHGPEAPRMLPLSDPNGTSQPLEPQVASALDCADDQVLEKEQVQLDEAAKSAAASPPVPLATSPSTQPSEYDIGDAWDDPWETIDENGKQESASQSELSRTSSEDITTNKLNGQGSDSGDFSIMLDQQHSEAEVQTPPAEPVEPAELVVLPPERKPLPEEEPWIHRGRPVELRVSHAHPESPLFREAPRSMSPQPVAPRPLPFPNISSISRPLRAHSPNHPNWAVAPPSPPPARNTSSPLLSTTKPSGSPAKRIFAGKAAPIGQRRGSWLALDHEKANSNDEDKTSPEVVSPPKSADAKVGFVQPPVIAPLPVRIGNAVLNGYGRRHTTDSPDWAVASSPSPDFTRSDSPWSSGGEGSGAGSVRRRRK